MAQAGVWVVEIMPSTKYIQEVLYICLMIRSLRQVAMALGSVRDSPVEIAWSRLPGRAGLVELCATTGTPYLSTCHLFTAARFVNF